MKRLVALILCVLMLASVVPTTVFAASPTLVRETELAEDLKALGLFRGVSDTDFALSRAPTRAEALVMLVRILGKENEALSRGGKHPFLDVPSWADKYVGYAYESKLTNGVSATKFGSDREASASMYITFVLRALGYSDQNGDFTWDNPFALARDVGILGGNPDVLKFLRGDVVLISYAALEAEVKGTGKTLAEKLIDAKVFTKAQYEKYYNDAEFENEDKAKGSYSSEEIYKICSPAVFCIEIYDENGKALSLGSGFFIDSEGTAVTNYHVIEGAVSAKIHRSDNGKVYKVEGVYDYSEKEDWAVIKIAGDSFPYLEIEKSEAVVGGQTVYAIGSPLGLENTISEGLVSNANRVLDGDEFIQISVPISPGSSGGALINRSGKVVGITSEGFDAGQNLNLARPISVIEGYRKERAFPLTAMGSFEDQSLPLGEIDTSGMTNEEKAETLLRAWIENNATGEVSYGPVFSEEYEVEGGATQYIGAVYSEELKTFIVLNLYFFANGAECSSYVAFRGKDNTATVNYQYRDETKDKLVDESKTEHKIRFHKYMDLQFDRLYSSVEGIETHEDNANFLWLESVQFVDEIIRKNLKGYGLEGIEDFGFTEFHTYK